MLSSEIAELISKYPCVQSSFSGVFAIDTIPNNIPINHFIIFNQDFSTNYGIHWLTLIRTKKYVLECFDSLGLNTDKQSLLTKHNSFTGIKFIKFNETEFQSTKSNNCGLFAVYFAINRLLNKDLSLKVFLSEYFTTDVDKNDHIIKSFFEHTS